MASERQHTAEPWEATLGDDGNILGVYPKSYGVPIATMNAKRAAVQNRADAKRICAAVNACAGIPTADLRPGVVAELLATSSRLLDRTKQREALWDGAPELLTAASRLAADLDSQVEAAICVGLPPPAFDGLAEMKAAVAAAEGRG